MPRTNLTDARVDSLKPRRKTYGIRDGKLGGFGVRVLPSGRKRFFVHCQHDGERVWKIVGDAAEMSVAEARARAVQMLAAIRRGDPAPSRPEETLFEHVAATVFRRHQRIWKAGTIRVNRNYLENQILPHFAGRPIADIDAREVRNWFASLHATPVSTDRSMPVLSVIMREAEATGLRPEGSNPCKGIRRYRRKGRARFLSDEEIRKLSERLSARAKRHPGQVAIVRLHDLRHTYASIALRRGETVLAIARLLGRRSPETTLGDTHVADAMAMDAAEIVGIALGDRP